MHSRHRNAVDHPQARSRVGVALCFAALLVALVILSPTMAQAAWPDPVRVSDDLVDSSATIGVSDDGTTTVIWTTPSGPDPGQAIRLARISPGGIVGTPIEIVRADSRFTIVDAALGVGPDGTAVVAWSDFLNNPSRVSAVRVSPDNRPGPVQTLASPSYNGIPPAYGKKVAVDPAGNATVAWYRDLPDRSASVAEVARLPVSGALEPAKVLGSGSGHLWPSLAVLPDRRILAAWSSQYDMPPRIRTISATGILGEVTDLDTTTGGETSIATSSNGLGVVAWVRAADRTLHVRRITVNGSIGPDVQLSNTGERLGQYRLALTASGVITAAWTDYQDIRVARILADGAIVAPTTVSTAPIGYCLLLAPPPPPPPPGAPMPPGTSCEMQFGINQIELGISVDNANAAHTAWIGADNRIRARRVPLAGAPEPTRVLSPPSSRPSRNPKSVTAPNGVGTTMWLDSSSGTQQLYVAPSGSGAVEDPTEPPPPPPPPVSEPPPPPPDPSSSDEPILDPRFPCPRAEFIGVRGSGEPSGFGTPIEAFRHELHENLKTELVASQFYDYALPYRADAVDWDLLVPGYSESRAIATKYRRSVDDGTGKLKVHLKAANARCSKTLFVLGGYSQGAHVIGDVIADGVSTRLRKRVVAAVFFGDPKFNGNDDALLLYGSFDAQFSGIRRPRAAGALKGVPRDFPVLSFCRDLDSVCQRLQWGFIPNAFVSQRAHERYQEHGYADEAARLLANELPLRLAEVTR